MVFRSVATSLRCCQPTSFSECRTRCTMHNCTSVCGKTLSIASGKPFSPSTQAIKMSLTPRFFSSVTTCSQNFGPFRLRDPQAEYFLQSVHRDANRQVNRFVFHVPAVAYLELDGVQIHDRVDLVELPVLPRLHLINYFVRHARDQGRRDFHVVDLLQMLLDLAR